MFCPKCNSEFNRFNEKIIKREDKHCITYSCPKCLAVLKEKETRFSLGVRIAFWILAIPSVMLLFVVVMSEFPRYIFNYVFLAILTLVVFATQYFKIKKRNLNIIQVEDGAKREVVQRVEDIKLNEVKKSSDPLMNKIVENTEKEISAKSKSKKIKYFSGIFVVMMIIFSSYPSIIKTKDLFMKMNKLNIDAANSARDLRGNQLAEELNRNYDLLHAYPVSLEDEIIKSGDEIFKEIRIDYEKDSLGKEIKLSDFNYKRTGQEFELCLNDGEYSKCWRGKEGKK